MRLQPGERLTSTVINTSDNDSVARAKRRNAAIYVVREPIIETPWYGLYRGRKVFRNSRTDGLELDETDDGEWLDVLLKTINYTRCDSREYVKSRRDQVWFEAKRVLGCRDTNLLPEPLDYLEVTNAHDTFTFPRTGQLIHKEPVLVFENITGQPLAKWCVAQRPDVPRVLRVLAEILEFLHVMHAQGFVANSVSPAAFWIDASDRVYHMGSDCVVASNTPRAIVADRFPQGFSPREAFQSTQQVDCKTDLYSWASLAYFLICNESPATIAASQREMYAKFSSAHYAKLTQRLRTLSREQRRGTATLLGVKGTRFERHFPDSFVHAISLCLSELRDLRPSSVVTLREWFAKSPPPAISGALALRNTTGDVEILVPLDGLDQRLELVIQRGTQPVKRPTQGADVYSGRLQERITDLEASKLGTSIHYSLFCRDRSDGEVVHSEGRVADLIDLRTHASLVKALEPLTQTAPPVNDLFEKPTLPDVVQLLSKASASHEVAQQMLSANDPLIRRWAIAILSDAIRGKESYNVQQLSSLLWQRGLSDPIFELRLAAAAGILQESGDPGIGLLGQLSKALGGESIDDRIRALRSLHRCGVWASAIQVASRALEADRIVACSVCATQIRAAQIDEHLRTEHGYIEVDSRLLPRAEATRTLWHQMLELNEPKATVELVALLVAKDQSVEVLQSQLVSNCKELWMPQQQRATKQEADAKRRRLVTCLRNSPLMLLASWKLISDEIPELRELGREALMPTVANKLSDDNGSTARFRQFVDALTQQEPLGGKIAVCRALAKAGASALVAGRAAADYELDREIACPDCGSSVSRRNYAKHERRTHGRYVFDGRAWQWQELLTHLGKQLLSGRPTLDIAQLFVDILDERIDSNEWTVRFTAELLPAIRDNAPLAQRFDRIELCASVLAQLSRAAAIALGLLRHGDAVVKELGLAMIGSSAMKIIPQHAEAALSALQRADVDERFRRSAAAEFVRKVSSRDAENVLRAVIKPLPDKLIGIEYLRLLQAEIGACEPIETVCMDLERTMRLACPICKVVLSGEEMQEHVQTNHRMVWEGRRLRHPWNVAEDCLEQYAQDGKLEWLEAGERYAFLSGGDEHRVAFMRASLRRGLATDRYLPHLEAIASQLQSCLCGACYESILSPRHSPMMAVTINEEGGLISDYVCIRKVNTLLQTEPEILIDGGIWTEDQPPGHFSRKGVAILWLLFFAATLVGTAILSLVSPELTGILFGAWLLAAVISGGFAALYRPRHASPISVAWEYVVPSLTASEVPERTKLAFVTGLSRASEVHADRGRQRLVEATCRCFHKWLNDSSISYAAWATVHRLLLIDQLRNQTSGAHAAQTLTNTLQEWSEGRLPTDALDVMTANGELFLRLPPAQQRLVQWRWLSYCARTGMNPKEVLALADVGPLFRKLLTCPEPQNVEAIAVGFAVLKVASKSLEQIGASNILQAAATGDLRAFNQPIDGILWSKYGDLVVRGEGLYFRGQRLERVPRLAVRVQEQFVQTGWTYQRADGMPDQRYKNNPPVGYNKVTGYLLTVDAHSFTFATDPSGLRDQIHNWAMHYFNLLAPEKHRYLNALQKSNRHAGGATVQCSNCGKTQTFVEGKLGMAC